MLVPVPTRATYAALAGIGLLVLSACGNGDDSTAATVNGTEISAEDVEAQSEIIAENPATQQQMEGADEEQVEQQLNADALSQLIFEIVMTDGAAELGVEVTDDDVTQTTEEIAMQFGGEDAMYEELEEQGLDRDEVDRQLRFAALQDAIMVELGAGVDDEAVEEAYAEGTPARHILVEDEDEANEVFDRIDGGEDFAEVAQETSLDGSAEAGGDLGFIQPGMTVTEFEEALFAADEGEVVGPVQSDFGYHVIQRLEKPEFEEVQDELRANLEQVSMQEGQMAFQDFITEQLQAADVDVDPEYGEWNAEMGQVMPDDPVQPPQPEQPLPEDLDDLDLEDLDLEDLEDPEDSDD
nr:peptidylprolyl isomerase [Phytoactinopolyspora mesophila]